MSYGLQVLNAQGIVIVDSDTFAGKVIGSFDASGVSGVHVDDDLLTGEAFVIPVVTMVNGPMDFTGQSTPLIPKINIDGNRIVWSRAEIATESRGMCIVYYGVY